MALAKNLALHGILGPTRFEFSNASSSPLWTLLLTGVYKLTGVGELTPLVIALAASIGATLAADAIFRMTGVGSRLRAAGLLWIVLVAPMAPLVFTGMEHTLHIFATLAFVGLVGRVLSDDCSPTSRLVLAGALGGMSVALRYEGLAVVAAAVVLAMVRRRFWFGLWLSITAVLPVLAFGLASLASGGSWLPNSMLIKLANGGASSVMSGDPLQVLVYLGSRFMDAYPVYFAAGSVAALLVWQWRVRDRRVWSPQTLIPIISILGALGHSLFGDFGWFYRYEAYLMVLLGVSAVVQIADVWAEAEPIVMPCRLSLKCLAAGVSALVLVAAVLSGSLRGALAVSRTPYAMKVNYMQDYQLGRFIRASFPRETVVLADLGAISYLNDDIRVIDLFGLGQTTSNLRRMEDGRFTEQVVRQMAQEEDARIALLFPDMFEVPAEWQAVAVWSVPKADCERGATASARFADVAIYAVKPEFAALVRDELRAFCRKDLPPDVAVTFVPADSAQERRRDVESADGGNAP